MLALLSCASIVAISGVQPVVVMYATRNAPTFTMDQVRANIARVASMVEASSYGQYRLSPQAFGPYRVPTTTRCSGSVYGPIAESVAVETGVTFPTGVSPWVWSDCGHLETTYISSIPGAKRGVFSDGKMLDYLFGLTIGLGTAYAEVIPYIGTNPFDPYTPMGYMPKGGYNARERWAKGWIIPSQIRADDTNNGPSNATQFIETTEKLGTSQIKIWRLSNGIEIDVRNFGGGKAAPSLVTLHRGNLLDLDPFNLCRWYTLTVGQIYTAGDGIGIRTESLAADGSGATVSAFPYTGPITARCPVGSK